MAAKAENRLNEDKEVIIKVDTDELRFSVGITAFNTYQNDFLPNSKIAPSENFLARCVHPDDADKVTKLCDQGFTLDLATMVADEFKPDIVLAVKK